MQESILLNISIDFSVKIIELYKKISIDLKESIMSKQMLRSGTSIGANIHEAQYGNSKADFISKLHIALKETNETKYWLTILNRTKYVDESKFKELANECEKIKAMLIKSLRTCKNE